MYLYLAVEQQMHTVQAGAYRTFGLEIYETAGGRLQKCGGADDVWPEAGPVCALARDCTLEQVEPCHLLDVVADWLAARR